MYKIVCLKVFLCLFCTSAWLKRQSWNDAQPPIANKVVRFNGANSVHECAGGHASYGCSWKSWHSLQSRQYSQKTKCATQRWEESTACRSHPSIMCQRSVCCCQLVKFGSLLNAAALQRPSTVHAGLMRTTHHQTHARWAVAVVSTSWRGFFRLPSAPFSLPCFSH